jgi:hypothetical protein
MLLPNIVTTEGSLIASFSKNKKTIFLKKDPFFHASWKKSSILSLSSSKKVDFLKKRYFLK